MPVCQVSETEREDLEESEKVQHWVECLCQTRLEQISCVENESPEVPSEKNCNLWRFDLLDISRKIFVTFSHGVICLKTI